MSKEEKFARKLYEIAILNLGSTKMTTPKTFAEILHEVVTADRSISYNFQMFNLFLSVPDFFQKNLSKLPSIDKKAAKDIMKLISDGKLLDLDDVATFEYALEKLNYAPDQIKSIVKDLQHDENLAHIVCDMAYAWNLINPWPSMYFPEDLVEDFDKVMRPNGLSVTDLVYAKMDEDADDYMDLDE